MHVTGNGLACGRVRLMLCDLRILLMRRLMPESEDWYRTTGELAADLDAATKKYLELKESMSDRTSPLAEQRRLMDGMGKILAMPTSELETAQEQYGFSAETFRGSWRVSTEHCCLGGCEIGEFTFSQQRDALIFCAFLDLIQFQPASNIACPRCYAEYMQDCI